MTFENATGTQRNARVKHTQYPIPNFADFLDLELRWLKLARSYEVSERFKTFSGARFKGPEAVR